MVRVQREDVVFHLFNLARETVAVLEVYLVRQGRGGTPQQDEEQHRLRERKSNAMKVVHGTTLEFRGAGARYRGGVPPTVWSVLTLIECRAELQESEAVIGGKRGGGLVLLGDGDAGHAGPRHIRDRHLKQLRE